MHQVMVLAAGRGARLGALTTELPKPLVPVGDRPILRHLLDYLAAHGVDRVVVNTHHLAHRFDDFDPGAVELTRVYESELLGTAGGVAGAREHLGDHCLIWNSDVFTTPPIDQLLCSAREEPITLLVSDPAFPPGCGTVGLGLGSRIVRLRGESFGQELASADYIGIAAIGPDVLRDLPHRGCLIGDVCLPRLRARKLIATLAHAGEWSDIGTLASYLKVNRDWLRQSNWGSFMGTGATLAATVQLGESVVGARAEIIGAGQIRRCVVWPGAKVLAPLADAVVLSSGRVVHVE